MISNIDSLSFGIYSEKEIEEMSVCEITSKSYQGSNTLYDERMGVLEDKKCLTCKKGSDCAGHFGFIRLNKHIIHPLMFRKVVNFLKCFCYKCSNSLISKEYIELYGYQHYKGQQRFKKILELIKKRIDRCSACNQAVPNIILNTNDNTISLQIKKDTEKLLLSEYTIEKILENIKDEDISLLGFDISNFHPRNLILKNLLVLPPISRPCVMSDGVAFDDDLTIQYAEIIKINKHLENKELTDSKRQKYIQSLKFRVKSLFDNSHDKAKHTNGRSMKCIKKRISSKDGLVRNNLMGKRVNKSARSVIGPDPTLKLNEIALPRKIAKILTIPIHVNIYNIESLQKLVGDGKANFVVRNGVKINLKYVNSNQSNAIEIEDIILHTHDSKTHTKILNIEPLTIRKINYYIYDDFIYTDKYKYTYTIINLLNKHYVLKPGDKIMRNNTIITPESKTYFKIQMGDIVERQVLNGDFVILNRQPTLHKGSMLGKKVILRDEYTIRMNLATTATFNADFDGDEMNVHVPISYQSRSEIELLSNTKFNIITSQSSKPIIKIVQDSLLGAYIMTKYVRKITKPQFFQIMMKIKDIPLDDMLDKIENRVLDGRLLFSLLLPRSFHYKKGDVLIEYGYLKSGVIKKSVLTSSHNCIIQLLHSEYDEQTAMNFINNIQFITNEYLLLTGFSIGIKDCIVKKRGEIKKVITKCLMEAEALSKNTIHPRIREAKINAALSKARDNGMRIAKNALNDNNNFVKTVSSGSKGNFFNIAQIAGLLGQQNMTGARIQPVISRGKRTLPHYPFKLINEKMKYRSRGFITSSFAQGLTPRDYWFHSMTGREGVTDTAVKTASTGYIQRRMIKLLEDLKIHHDHTVRNTNNDIIQLAYGEDTLDGTKTVILNDTPVICNIPRLIDRLNKESEEKKVEKKVEKKKVEKKAIKKKIEKKITKKKKIENYSKKYNITREVLACNKIRVPITYSIKHKDKIINDPRYIIIQLCKKISKYVIINGTITEHLTLKQCVVLSSLLSFTIKNKEAWKKLITLKYDGIPLCEFTIKDDKIHPMLLFNGLKKIIKN